MENDFLNYGSSPGSNTVLEPLDVPNEVVGSETTITSVNPVDLFFSASPEQRWKLVDSVPYDESSVQQIVRRIVEVGHASDVDDAISLLAAIGWSTYAVARAYRFIPTRFVKPMYVNLGWELLTQGLVTARIDAEVKRQLLNDLAHSRVTAISYVAQDALESIT